MSHEFPALAPEPRRYPIVLAACWLAGCGVVDAAAAGTVSIMPFYLPAILPLAWYHGLRPALAAAAAAAAATAVAAYINGPPGGLAVQAWNLFASTLLFALPAWLVFELREQRRRIASLVVNDPVTGLLNRQGLLTTLGDELVRTERFGGETSVVCLGLNGMARMYAARGAQATDAMVRGFCEALGSSARRTDSVARLATDEFALLLRETGPDAAGAVADKLSRTLTEWLLTQGKDLSCSVGYTSAPRGRALDALALLARAVAQMYEQRSAGSNPRRSPVTSLPLSGTASSVQERA